MAKYKAARTDAVSSREKEHLALVRSLAPQCMVLLENNGVLPLASPCPVALFGSGARRTVCGAGPEKRGLRDRHRKLAG